MLAKYEHRSEVKITHSCCTNLSN